MKKFVFYPLLILFAALAGWYGWVSFTPKVLVRNIKDFTSCMKAGYPVMESYPRVCRTSGGRNFVEEIQVDKSDLIVVDTPKPGATVTSPLVVKGKARGSWFFEASFPVELMVGNEVIARGLAKAQSTWETNDFVPFKATVDFSYTFGLDKMPALLVLKKDNPSGLSKYDDTISVPIVLSPYKATSTSSDSCGPTGCSGQICSDKEVITTCEFRTDYACYHNGNAICERQASGQCGWTDTPKLQQCLEHPPTGPNTE